MLIDLIYHDSHDTIYREPFGAVTCLSKIKLALKINSNEQPERVVLILWRDNEDKEEQDMQKTTTDLYQINFTTPEKPGLLWYSFMVVFKGRRYYYGNNSMGYGGVGLLSENFPSPYQITVYDKDGLPPDWFKDTIMYQVFVDRFFNGNENGEITNPKKNSLIQARWDNDPIYLKDGKSDRVARWDFFGGNLDGIKQKLTYLKELGIKVLYLNPIFESPSNHKYDTGDYHKIDSMFGDYNIFNELCLEAKKMGIYIILDGVFNHTGSDSIYFNKEGNYQSLGAYQSKESPYYSWYRFNEFPHWYESWWGIDVLPNVNELEPSFMDFIIFNENSVLKHWARAGIKGWRLDVADELPDTFIKHFRNTLKEFDQDSILIGEVWEDASNKISYGQRREYLLGEELDSVMNYPFRMIAIDYILLRKNAKMTHQVFMSLYENYPIEHFYSMMNLIGSHDVPRILTILQEELSIDLSDEQKKATAIKRLKLITLLQMTFPGVPSIYYGDEVGVEGGEDPSNRRTYPWGKENQDLLYWFKQLTSIRNYYDVMRRGNWVSFFEGENVYGYYRETNNNTAIILINPNLVGSEKIVLSLESLDIEKTEFLIEFFTDKEIPIINGKIEVEIEPLEGKILLKDRWKGHSNEQRKSGVLLHPTSLPSRYGIGDLGESAYKFIDFLSDARQKIWQILPLNPPGYGESPYQCYSAIAGNHLLIDIEQLIDLLNGEDIKDIPFFNNKKIEFDKVKEYKGKLLKLAFNRFEDRKKSTEYLKYLKQNKEWLDDYSLFMALKEHFGGLPWNRWDTSIALRNKIAVKTYHKLLQSKIDYHKFLQFNLFKQWKKVKDYANSRGIEIIGDIPIFVAHDSCDVWVNPELFELDQEGSPSYVAGVPPDYFSETGQRWGNPLYKWDKMQSDDYLWWRKRFKFLLQWVDKIRIDHFRGFESFWQIPGNELTAIKGKWVKGPGKDFFTNIKQHLGELPIILEDLGIITEEVKSLKTQLGYPGMLVLQYINESKLESPLNIPLYNRNTILYTGTHDNNTLYGWYMKSNVQKQDLSEQQKNDICWGFIEKAFKSDVLITIVPLQDILCLDSKARMNKPGTVGGNWLWRYDQNELKEEIGIRLKNLTEKYKR